MLNRTSVVSSCVPQCTGQSREQVHYWGWNGIAVCLLLRSLECCNAADYVVQSWTYITYITFMFNIYRKITFVAARSVTIQQATQLHLHVLYTDTVLRINTAPLIQWLYSLRERTGYNECIPCLYMSLVNRAQFCIQWMDMRQMNKHARAVEVLQWQCTAAIAVYCCDTSLWSVEAWKQGQCETRVTGRACRERQIEFWPSFSIILLQSQTPRLTPSIKLDWQCACIHSWLLPVLQYVCVFQWGQVSGPEAMW
jgi:hypothetical protein